MTNITERGVLSGVSRRAFLAGTGAVTASSLIGRRAWAQAQNSTLRIGMSSFDSENLDPAAEARSAVINTYMMLYDSIFEIGPNNELIPGIAESWSTDDTGTVWTLNIRKGVQFHGGYGEVTAEDVAFSLMRFFDEGASKSSSRKPLIAAMDTVEATDEYTVVIKTKGVISGLLYLLSPHQAVSGIVYCKKYMESAGATFDEQSKLMNERPIGTGPYEFVSRRRGQSMTFGAVDNHWRVNPEIREVEWFLIPDPSTQLIMLQSGELDLISVDPDRAEQVKSVEGLEIQSFPNGLDFAINIYGSYADSAKDIPTADVRVRHALSKAIDRKTIIEALMGGYAKLPDVPFGVSATADGVDATAGNGKAWAEDVATYDPEGAKQLLAEAGYPDGFSGVKIYTFNIAGRLNNTPDLILAIAAQWAKIGINIEVAQMDYAIVFPHLIGDPNDPFIAGQLVSFSNQPRFTLENYLDVWFKSTGSSKLLHSEALDSGIRDMSLTLDTAKRTDIGTKELDIVRDEWTSLAIFTADSLFAVNKSVVGSWNPRPGYAFLARNIELIKLPA